MLKITKQVANNSKSLKNSVTVSDNSRKDVTLTLNREKNIVCLMVPKTMSIVPEYGR